jgi:hypothetical protein
MQRNGPGNPRSRKYLADLFGLTMLVDIGPRRFPVQFIVSDTVPKDHIKFLPKSAHWKVMR